MALAVILNLNKWIYFTFRIQAHINIREYEIAEIVAEEKEDQEQEQMRQEFENGGHINRTGSTPTGGKVDVDGSFHYAVSDIHDLEIRKLRKYKYINHFTTSTIALTIIGFYSYYYTLACGRADFYTESE